VSLIKHFNPKDANVKIENCRIKLIEIFYNFYLQCSNKLNQLQMELDPSNGLSIFKQTKFIKSLFYKNSVKQSKVNSKIVKKRKKVNIDLEYQDQKKRCKKSILPSFS